MDRGGRPRGVDGPPVSPIQELQRRALVAIGARQLDFRRVGSQLGGTLIVDDASHKREVQQAVKQGNISFGFSAGGCLFPYYIGCAGALIDAGILTDGIKIGGASAGSLLAACIKAGMPLDGIVEANLQLMSDLRASGTRGRMGPVLHAFLRQHLPEDAHLRCRGRAFVAVTRVAPLARPSLISDFRDREDLIQALMTSCHIPFWMDGTPFAEFRGERHCDGGLTNFIPLPPDTVGVRVCCFPSKQLSPVYRIGISPDSFKPWDYSLRQMVEWAFQPADETIVAALIDKGKQDAEAWMESMELVRQRQEVRDKAERAEGQVAAAKTAAVGDADDAAHQQAQQEGEQRLEERARGDGGPEADAGLPTAAAATDVKEQQAQGQAGAQQQAVESAAAEQERGASKEEQLAAAEQALREAQEKEGGEGNLWAKALGAAGVAASAGAVAAAVTQGLVL